MARRRRPPLARTTLPSAFDFMRALTQSEAVLMRPTPNYERARTHLQAHVRASARAIARTHVQAPAHASARTHARARARTRARTRSRARTMRAHTHLLTLHGGAAQASFECVAEHQLPRPTSMELASMGLPTRRKPPSSGMAMGLVDAATKVLLTDGLFFQNPRQVMMISTRTGTTVHVKEPMKLPGTIRWESRRLDGRLPQRCESR